MIGAALPRAGLFVAFALVAARPVFAEAPAPRPPDAGVAAAGESIDAWLQKELAGRPHAGLSVAFSWRGETWSRGYGLADVERKRPATPETSYRMASVTKMFTATAVMQLVEKGRVRLDAPIQRYVPGFPKKRWPITVRHLLGHLSGISHYRDRGKETHFRTHFSTEQALAVFKDWDLEAAPGTKYVYTSYGYNLLGAAVENVSGLSYGAYLQRRIFGPLQMRDSAVEDPARRTRRWARGYRLKEGTLRPSEDVDISSRFGGGGTRSTVLDMVRFGEALLDGRVVAPETLALMQESMATDDGKLTDYGIGMAAYPLGGRFVTAHAGAQPETSTLLMVLPAEGLVIAIAQNLEDQWSFNSRIAGRISEVVLQAGERRRGLQGKSLGDHLMAAGLLRVFSHGLAQYRLREGRIDDGPGDLLAAFETTRALLSPSALASDPVGSWERIQLGLGPGEGRALAKAGAYMAGVLATVQGREAVEAYPRLGTLSFVADFIEACRMLDCPTGLRLGPDIEGFVARTATPYHAANPPWLRTLAIEDEEDVVAFGNKLKELFKATPVRPDLSGELRDVGDVALERGDLDRAGQIFELGHELFPQDARTAVDLALVRYARGERDRADLLLDDAVLLPDAEDRLTAARLRYEAWVLEKRGHAAASRDLVAWACRHHPDDAKLLDLLAKKRAELGDPRGAVQALEQAQEVEPSARRAAELKKLKVLTSSSGTSG